MGKMNDPMSQNDLVLSYSDDADSFRKEGRFGSFGGEFGFFNDGGIGRRMEALPDNFHDADASTKVTPDGKVLKNKYEIHKAKGDNFKSFSYSTSNSISW